MKQTYRFTRALDGVAEDDTIEMMPEDAATMVTSGVLVPVDGTGQTDSAELIVEPVVDRIAVLTDALTAARGERDAARTDITQIVAERDRLRARVDELLTAQRAVARERESDREAGEAARKDHEALTADNAALRERIDVLTKQGTAKPAAKAAQSKASS